MQCFHSADLRPPSLSAGGVAIKFDGPRVSIVCCVLPLSLEGRTARVWLTLKRIPIQAATRLIGGPRRIAARFAPPSSGALPPPPPLPPPPSRADASRGGQAPAPGELLPFSSKLMDFARLAGHLTGMADGPNEMELEVNKCAYNNLCMANTYHYRWPCNSSIAGAHIAPFNSGHRVLGQVC